MKSSNPISNTGGPSSPSLSLLKEDQEDQKLQKVEDAVHKILEAEQNEAYYLKDKLHLYPSKGARFDAKGQLIRRSIIGTTHVK